MGSLATDLIIPKRGRTVIGKPKILNMHPRAVAIFEELCKQVDLDFVGSADNRGLCHIAILEHQFEMGDITTHDTGRLIKLRDAFGLTPYGRKQLTNSGKERKDTAGSRFGTKPKLVASNG